MTWPTTPVSTTHLDAATDNPADARADIKQMADNVNAITDTFSITSPSTGDLLVYNNSTQKFENKAQTTALGYLTQVAVIDFSYNGTQIQDWNNPLNTLDKWYRVDPTEITDPNSFVTVGTGYFSLGTGTYLFMNSGHAVGTPGVGSWGFPVYWCNRQTPTSASDIIKTMPSNFTGVSGGTSYYLSPDYYLFRTVTGSETYSWWMDSVGSGSYDYPALVIVKLL
jgi:hypothetical protein